MPTNKPKVALIVLAVFDEFYPSHYSVQNFLSFFSVFTTVIDAAKFQNTPVVPNREMPWIGADVFRGILRNSLNIFFRSSP